MTPVKFAKKVSTSPATVSRNFQMYSAGGKSGGGGGLGGGGGSAGGCGGGDELVIHTKDEWKRSSGRLPQEG